MGTPDGWRERALVWPLIVICSFALAVVALTYVAVHKIKPESFRISATVTKWVSFKIEIKSSEARHAEAAAPERAHVTAQRSRD
jgi:hypothetical protein